VKFGVYQVSRRGGREKNEDRMGYCYTRESAMFALADGMGGHPEGDMASQLALHTVANIFQREATPSLQSPGQFLEEAINLAHQQLLRYGIEKKLGDTPRTTIVVCVLQHGYAYWAHCGDSRLYMVRARELVARTRDHSYSELQEALGRHATGAERFNRNVLFTCLGSPGKPMIDISGPTPMERGDRFLLCSDGLWGNLSDPMLVQLISERVIADAVPELVEQALRVGGPKCDNVTALAIEWEGSDPQEANAAIVTQELGQEDFSSTIQSAEVGTEAPEVLDDAEIDRSVREIQDVIRRNAGKKP